MNNEIATIERVGVDNKIVQITLNKGTELPVHLKQIENLFKACFKKKDFELILNMANIQYPPTKFMALLIEVTNVARRFGGDIKILNLQMSAKNNLISFSTKSYLSILESEEYALYEFGEDSIILSAINTDTDSDDTDTENLTIVQETSDAKSDKTQSLPEFSDAKTMKGDKIRILSKIEKLYDACDFVIDKAKIIGFDIKELGKLKVAIYEACLNVIEHAYFSSPENWIEVSVFHDSEKMIIVIHDWGESFEYHPATNYSAEKAMDDRKTGGFGMHIIQRSVDEIMYEPNEELGNKLFLLKYLNSDKVMIK